MRRRGSPWANPFKVASEDDRVDVIEKYRAYITERIESGELDPTELRGKRLGCWCKPHGCHGDVLCEIVDAL
jgi:hypothetical protein